MPIAKRPGASTALLALGIFAVAAGIACLGNWRTGSSRAPAAATPVLETAALKLEATTPALEAPKARELRYRLDLGKRYTYAFSRQIRINGPGGKIPEISYSGFLLIDVPVHPASTGSSAVEAVASALLPGLAAPPEVRLGLRFPETGETLSLRTREKTSDEEEQVANVLKDLIIQWLFPLTEDSVGAYQARIERIGDGEFRKTKIAYASSNGFQSRNKAPGIVSSVHRLTWDSTLGLPKEIRGDESTRLGEDPDYSFATQSSYSLRLVSIKPAPGGTADAPLRPEPLSLSANHPSRARSLRQLALRDLRRSLGALERGDLSQPEQVRLFGDLVDYLREQGSALDGLIALLPPSAITQGPASPLFKMTVGVLATLGTAEAQAELLGIYQDPGCTVSGKGMVLSALTTTQAALDPGTRAFLMDETQSSNAALAAGALWALGASLQRSPGNSPDDPSERRAIQVIQQDWTASASGPVEQQTAILDAMGNSGRPEFLPVLVSEIDAQDPALRDKAIFALRFIPTPEAVSLLGSELGSPNGGDRMAAASAIQVGSWSPSLLAPVQTCAKAETIPRIQSICQWVAEHHGP